MRAIPRAGYISVMNKKLAALSDARLVAQALEQDQAAFGEIYDRYGSQIYSFCRARLRNEADASDAMQDTFVRAASRLDQLRQPEKLRSWLFAIARNEIISTGKTAAKAVGGDAMDEVIDLRGDVDVDLLAAEASAELWAAADGLTVRDQEILELHVRHGLVGQELGDALGLPESTANVALSRLKDRIAICMGSLLVARGGRGDCDELDQLLGDWNGAFTLDLRSRVTRHVKNCDVCEDTKKTLLAAGAFALPVIEVPAGLRSPTVKKMAESSKTATPGTGSSIEQWAWRDDGFPGDVIEERGAASFFSAPTSLLATAAAVLAVVLGVWWVSADDEVTTIVASNTVVANSTTSSSAQIEQSTTAVSTTSTDLEPSSTAPATVATTTGTSAAPSSASTAPNTTDAAIADEPVAADPAGDDPGDGAPTDDDPVDEGPAGEDPDGGEPTGDDPPGDGDPAGEDPVDEDPTDDQQTDEDPADEEPENLAPQIRLLRLGSSEVLINAGSCIGGRTRVDVSVFDDGEIESVVATWAPTAGQTESSELALAGRSQYTGFAGPWEVSGFQSVTVTVTDVGGLTATAQARLEVEACPIGGFTS